VSEKLLEALGELLRRQRGSAVLVKFRKIARCMELRGPERSVAAVSWRTLLPAELNINGVRWVRHGDMANGVLYVRCGRECRA